MSYSGGKRKQSTDIETGSRRVFKREKAKVSALKTRKEETEEYCSGRQEAEHWSESGKGRTACESNRRCSMERKGDATLRKHGRRH